MKTEDFQEFKKHLGETFKVFDKAVDNDIVKVYFLAVKDYPLSVVIQALLYCSINCEFKPKPVDLVKALKEFTGQNKEQLEVKAHVVFKEFSHNINIGCDYVFEDERAASAFRQTFGSIVEYGKKTEDDTWLEKRFVDAYVSPYLENTGNVLGGLYAYTDDPLVRFIGDYDRCLEIVNTCENYQGKHPRLPEDPRKVIKIEYKGDDSPIIDKQEFERGMRQLFETCGIVCR